MKIEQSFTVARRLDDVWAFFQRIPDVAACMPGAELTGEKEPGLYTGKLSLKLGPFAASFEGEATVRFDPVTKSGHVEGKGVDKRGGSRSRMTVDFALDAPGADTTTVRLDADVTLSGAIAQFGRTGIIQETAKILIGDFVAKLEQRLAPPQAPAAEPAPQPVATSPAPSAGINSAWLFWRAVIGWLGGLFGHRA
jgi:carbon-monoxide dehydrogenase small subunit